VAFAAVDFTAAVFTGAVLMPVAREAIGDSYNESDYQSSAWHTEAASCC
jgi:hypothetical protein